MPLCRCKAVESHSLGIVLRNAATTHHRSTLQPQTAQSSCPPPRSPFPAQALSLRLQQHHSPNVAAAECALAVRAAQRRASRSQLKRSLHVLGHAWSAVNQHIRQVRVRGRVLQQRRPPPALRRLAEALLPVQPLPLLKRARTPKFFESFFLLIRTPLYFRKFLESTGIQYSPAATCTPTLETFGLNFGTNLPVVFGDQISLDTFFELFPASRALLIIIG
jgi:hypothetical protein